MTTLPFTVPNVFANSTSNIALSLLDADFISVTDAINGIGNGSTALTSVNITGGSVSNVSFSGGGGTGDIGRNLVHNSLFNIAQRGAGPFTTANIYTLDRWKVAFNNGTTSITYSALTDAQRAAIGDEAAAVGFSNTFTGSATAGSYNLLNQYIEGVRRLAGKTVTLSFWAVAGAAPPKLGVSLDQNFGTGGSPSAGVVGTGQAVTLTTTFARYSLTFAIPSAAGKTLGTNGDDYTALTFWFSAEATFNARSGNIGVQSAGIALWGVQLEIGSVATPLEKPDPRYDLANCQRFYSISQAYAAGYSTASLYAAISATLPVSMRAAPTITTVTNSSTGLSAFTIAALNPTSFLAQASTTAAGQWVISLVLTLSADL